MNSNWSHSPETPNLGQIRRFLEPCDLEIWRMTLNTIGHLYYATSSSMHHFVAISELSWSYSPERPNLGQNRRFLEPCDLAIWRMTLKNNMAPLLFYFNMSSFVCHFATIGVLKLELQSRNAQFGSNSTIFRDVWPWNVKFASFHHHMWIQTGVTVRKRLSWVVTSVTLTFDIWPWPFAWTLLWSLVITPENFMMIRW